MTEQTHKPFITVTSGMSGYFAVLMQWNEGGFYEPWDTGFGRYKDRDEAINEAEGWAEDEGLEYRP